ncbi:MAG: hypothetical protein ACOCZ6_04810 [Nanoarchaeota archaeon]
MSNIYILSTYANEENFNEQTYERRHESKICYIDKKLKIDLIETNSFVEDFYSLNLNSARFVMQGAECKEAMIHHHPRGHKYRHLQFKLKSRNEVIRINLEPLDEDDYHKCIKGFLSLSQKILQLEQEENKIETDLISYFFNEEIKKLKSDEKYLLRKIKNSFQTGCILDNKGNGIDKEKINILKKENHLLPFLDW